MRDNGLVFLVLFFSFLFIVGPVSAHHSFMGEFDVHKTIVLEGVVTRFEFVNPHISFDIDVQDASGKITHWNVQSGSPRALMNLGWSRNCLKPGDRITVEGNPARKGEPFAVAKKVTLADGRTLSANSIG